MRTLPHLAFALVCASAAACSSAPTQNRLEDLARQMAPPPACIMRLTPRSTQGLARNLKEEQYWEAVFPSFEKDKLTLPDRALTCTGRTVFDDPQFKDAERTNVYPAPVSDGDIMLGSGGDRLKVAWMRTHRTPEGYEVGPLVLARAKDDFAEVYAIGVYRGRTKRPYFGMERIGLEPVVTVADEDCTRPDRRPSTSCESTLAVYLPRKGVLVHLATFATEKRAYAVAGEPGAPGLIEYRLGAAPKFEEHGILLSEQILAIDEGGRELRHAELERVFKLDDTRLIPNEEALWPRVFPRENPPPTPEPKPPPPPAPPPAQGKKAPAKPG